MNHVKYNRKDRMEGMLGDIKKERHDMVRKHDQRVLEIKRRRDVTTGETVCIR